MTTTSSPPGEKSLRLRIFAYHLAVITQMKPGDRSEFYPVEKGGAIIVTCSECNAKAHFRVNDECTGNVWGATEVFARKVMEMGITSIHPDKD